MNMTFVSVCMKAVWLSSWEEKTFFCVPVKMKPYGCGMAWRRVNDDWIFTYGWTVPWKPSKNFHDRGATLSLITRSCQIWKFFFLISVWVWSGMWSSCCLSSDLWKCQWWQLACCVVTAFSSITVSPSTFITTLPGFLGQMPCLLKVARCTLGVIFPILFNLVLHFFMLPLFWHLSNLMSIDYGLD